MLGATGYIGGRLTPRLLNAGYRVRVLARDAVRAASFGWGEECEIFEGSADDEHAVASAMDDVDVVYYLIHSMSAGKGFEESDERAATTVATAAARAGVRRIVYLGGLHPDDVKLSPHLRSRVHVGEIFLESGVPTLVLQAGVVIGSGSASFEMIRHLTDVLPYMPAPKWVRNRIQPIAVRDVLHYLLGAARVDDQVNRAVDIGGPDVLRYGQMMNGYAVEAGLRQRAIAALPVLTPELASHWVNLVTPVPRSIARPLVASLQNECIMKDHAVDALIPRPEGGLTPYRRSVALALGRVDADAVETSWQDAEVSGAPSDPLPSDPDWAGRTVFTDKRSVATRASVAELWRVILGIGGENGGTRRHCSGRCGAHGPRDRRRGPQPGTPQPHRRPGRGCDRLLARGGGGADRGRPSAAAPRGDEGAGRGLARTARGARRRGRPLRTARRVLPRGLLGRLYWLAVLPFHGLIFSGMAARITAAAESGDHAGSGAFRAEVPDPA